jgi:hypothetical protein
LDAAAVRVKDILGDRRLSRTYECEFGQDAEENNVQLGVLPSITPAKPPFVALVRERLGLQPDML